MTFIKHINFSKKCFKLSLIFTILFLSPSTYCQNWDVQVLKAINKNHHVSTARWVNAYEKSVLGMVVGIPIAFYVYGHAAGKARWRVSALQLALAEISAYATTYILKRTFNRQRPYERYSWVKHDITEPDPSFPSGHTTGSAALTTFLIFKYKKPILTIAAISWTTGVALGRIYQGVHYPSDVITGAILGGGITYLFLRWGPIKRTFQSTGEQRRYFHWGVCQANHHTLFIYARYHF